MEPGRTPSDAPAGGWLGEFELIERLGEGGMGVVHRARQRSLGREVALKVVRPELLHFAGARERFLREAAAVARLQHPGIVPIYTFGEEGGLPYFAMELVVGATLSQVLARVASRRPETLSAADLDAALRAASGAPPERATPPAGTSVHGWVDRCLGLAAELARALDHAHQRGVVHRDVKPSNVMVTLDGRTRLLDFGLATTSEVSELTRSGVLVGSLHYLAPELWQGGSATPASDLYALGVVLYELLSGRPPFRGDKLEEVREQVIAGTVPSLRTINPAVPRDVETACLVAIEREARRRYASAAAFAEDLDRLRERRPILARRPGAGLLALRWVQRHPAWTTAAALSAVLLVGAPTFVALAQADKLRAVEEERGRTTAQRDRALRNFRLALDAVDRGIERIESEEFDDLPGFDLLRQGTYEDAFAIYAGFADEDAGDPALAAERGRHGRRRAELLLSLGREEEAEAAFRTALVELETLLAAEPADARLLFELGRSHELLAAIASARGDSEEAERQALAAIARFEQLAQVEPGSDDALRHAVDARLALLDARRWRVADGGGGEGGAPLREEALAIARGAEELAGRGSPDLAVHAASVFSQLSIALLGLAEPAHAERLAARGCELLEEGAPAAEATSLRRFAAFTRSQLEASRAAAREAGGDVAGAVAAHERAVTLLRQTCSRWPGVAHQEDALATLLNNAGRRLLVTGDVDAACANFAESLERIEARVDAAPALLEPRLRAASTALNLGAAELERDQPEVARDRLRAARDAALELRERAGDDRRVSGLLLAAGQFLAQAELLLGDDAAAAEAVVSIEPALGDDPDLHRRCATLFGHCAALAAGEDERDPAAAARDARVAGHLRRAASRLARAIELGFADRAQLAADEGLAPWLQTEPLAGVVGAIGEE